MEHRAPPVVTDGGTRPARVPPVLLIVVVAAVFLGIAAALLSGAPATPSTFQSTPGAFVTLSQLQIFGWIVIGSVVVWLVYRVVVRIRDPSGSALATQFVAGASVVLLLAVVFVFLARFLSHPAPKPPTGSGAANHTVVPPPPPPGGLPGNVSVGPINAPGWEAYLGLIVLVVVLAAVAIPVSAYLAARRRDAEEEPEPSESERSRAEIASTLAALEADPNADPRALIVALYGRLLASVDERVGGVEARTAREIELLTVHALGLPPDAARELTALFEEARYSPHPISSNDVANARKALRRILGRIDAETRSP
jgi:uncharacterized protein DUF4129